ncbi:MAG: hypothetical protein GY938_22300 [Ketobacter sp.]|nr:hypothetical protein [Ketobacter sp.]
MIHNVQKKTKKKKKKKKKEQKIKIIKKQILLLIFSCIRIPIPENKDIIEPSLHKNNVE